MQSLPPSDPLPATAMSEDSDRGPVLMAVVWTLLPLAGMVFAMRLYVRHHFTRQFGADDYWMIVTMILSLVIALLLTISVRMGFGIPIALAAQITPPETLMIMALATMAAALVQTLTIKLSITCFLLRLRPGRVYKLVVWVIILMNVIASTLGLAMDFAQCQPLGHMWDSSQPGTCWPRHVMVGAMYMVCVVCAISWFGYVMLPIVHTWNLQLPSYTKRAIWGLVGLGLIPAICATVKIAYAVELTDPDVTRSRINFYIAYTIELNIGIIVASVPPLKPYIDHRWPGLLTAPRSRSTSSTPKSFMDRWTPKSLSSSKSLTKNSKPLSSRASETNGGFDHHTPESQGSTHELKSSTNVRVQVLSTELV